VGMDFPDAIIGTAVDIFRGLIGRAWGTPRRSRAVPSRKDLTIGRPSGAAFPCPGSALPAAAH